MEWLDGCETVEDWGCSLAHAKRYCKGTYIGLDGTGGSCDKIVDLRDHKSSPDGIFMRHVLEHNLRWDRILYNAVLSFQKKMSLIFFRPFVEKETIEYHGEIPIISFNKKSILDFIDPYLKNEVIIHRKDKPLYDTVFLLEK